MPFVFPVHLGATVQDAFQYRLEGEYRARYERRIDRDFNGSRNDNRSDLLQRGRVGVSWKSGSKWSGQVQYQYAHNLLWTDARNASDMASDLTLLYAQYKEGGRVITIGRQRINLGSERLIGSLEWVNVGRTYDAIRYQDAQWDFFGGRIGVQFPLPGDVRLGAASYKSPYGTFSLIHKQDSGTAGDVNHFTLGYAYNRKWGAWEFDGEAALQRGRAENKDQDAWAYHFQLFYRTDPKTRLMFETNAASGGSDANTIRTFDNLYPTNHKFYGVMDLHAWKNLNMFAFGVSHQLRKDLDLKFRWSTSSLRDDRDAWYGAGGGANRTGTVAFRDLSGASGRDLGREFDFEATWKKNPRESISAGIAWFVPGNFVKRVSGDDRAQVFGFVMYSLKF